MSSIDRPREDPLIKQYTSCVHDKNRCLQFLIINARLICCSYSFSTFKEMCINYRVTYEPHKRNKIIHDFSKYILSKTRRHTSDLAISYNIIKNIKVDEALEEKIIDFMLVGIRAPSLDPYRKLKIKSLKHNRVLAWVKFNVIELRSRRKATGARLAASGKVWKYNNSKHWC